MNSNRSGLTPDEVAVLAYLLKSRYVVPSEIVRLTPKLVSKFKPQLAKFIQCVDSFRRTDAACLRLIDDEIALGLLGGTHSEQRTANNEYREAARATLITAFDELSAALGQVPFIQKRNVKSGEEDPLVHAMDTIEGGAVKHDIFKAIDAARQSSPAK